MKPPQLPFTVVAVVAVVVLGACGGAPRAGDGWPARPMTRMSGRLLGASGPPFTMLVPEGLFAETDFEHAPVVIVRAADALPATIDQMYAAIGSGMGELVVRKDPIDHGFVVTSRNADGTFVRVDVIKQEAGAIPWCHAFQRAEHPLGADTRAMLETICLSLRIE